MLYIDGISLNKIKDELKNKLVGKKINRIFQQNEHTLSLHFGKIEFILSCLPNLSVCYIADNKEKPLVDISSSFIASLRKYLLNSMMLEIEQLGFDRILVFNFSKINELGELKLYKLYFETFSKGANIILTDKNNKIIESFKRDVIFSNSSRLLFNGANYQRPYYNEKTSPLDLTEKDYIEYQNKNNLIENVEGIGKHTANFCTDFDSFKKVITDNMKSTIYFKDKKIVFASVLNLDISNKIFYDDVKSFEDYNSLINFYINYANVSTSFTLLKNKLLSCVNKKIKKSNKILQMISEDLALENNLENTKQKADILAASLYNLRKGMKKITLYDFYNNCDIEINLDPLKNPKENLEKYYKDYNKSKRIIENAKRRQTEIDNDLKYLSTLELFIFNSKDLESLRNIEEELISVGYLKTYYKTKKTKHKKEPKYGVLEFDNLVIYFGRNNTENDFLTFKLATKNNLWFHAKNIPGSHVILKAEHINEKNIEIAAKVAAFYSKASVGEKIFVDYTLKKYINKPSGSKPGFVTYTNEKSILVKKEEI